VALTVLLSVGVGVFLYFFWSFFGIVDDLSAHVAALGLKPANWPAFIAYFALVNPFVEEYFWRGCLGSPTKRLYLSDFVYAGFHALILTGNMPLVSIVYSLTVLVLAGWFWRQVARADGGLLAPVLGHMAADFTILILIYQMSR
jgi:membrane protease YdiL (CAAX protease family)